MYGTSVMRLVPLCAMLFAAALAAAPSTGGTAAWQQWRGPFFNGMAASDAPLTWSDGSGVRWKTEIPGRGFSTPVIAGNRIFLTTAVPTGETQPEAAPQRGPGGGAAAGQEHRFEVLALDRETGKVVWRQVATTATPHEGYHRIYGSFASNAPATDGARLYAFFGSRGLYAYDLDGRKLWEKDFGVQMRMHLQFGEGTAVVVHGDRLILNFDHEGASFLTMLDAATGREIWRVARDEGSSWSTPLVVEHGGRRQIVVSASRQVRGYDFATGKLIWYAAGLGTNVIPHPVQHEDLVIVMSGHRDPRLLAIRLGREGDLTDTDAIVWTATRGLSYTPSPVLHDGLLYLLTDSGQLSCYDAATGKVHYQQVRMPNPYNFKASPVGANGRLYLATEEGDVVVVKMGPEFEILATNTLADQSFIASPVIVDGDIYLRSRTHMFRIGGTRAETTAAGRRP